MRVSVCQKPVYLRATIFALASITPSTFCVWMRVLMTSSGQVTKPESAQAKKPLTKKAPKFWFPEGLRILFIQSFVTTRTAAFGTFMRMVVK